MTTPLFLKKKYWPIPASFSFIFVLFLIPISISIKKNEESVDCVNPGPQNGWHIQNNGATAAALNPHI